MEIAIGIFLGLGLAASCGFRVFVPLLITSIGSLTDLVHLSHGFEWMGSWPAFAVFLTATIAEVGAYYIPWLDNALDTVSIPLAAAAGTLLSVSFMTELPPMIQWTLGIIVGGGTAAIVKTAAGATRLGSSASTGGFANWLIATFEHIASFVMSILSFLLPIIMGIVAVGIFGYSIYRIALWRKRKKEADAKPELQKSPAV
jgi:hypothetical protein